MSASVTISAIGASSVRGHGGGTNALTFLSAQHRNKTLTSIGGEVDGAHWKP